MSSAKAVFQVSPNSRTGRAREITKLMEVPPQKERGLESPGSEHGFVLASMASSIQWVE